MAELALFDLPTPTRPCHYCGEPLSEMDMLLPATCERSLTCTSCCQPCHGKALARLMALAREQRSARCFPESDQQQRRSRRG